MCVVSLDFSTSFDFTVGILQEVYQMPQISSVPMMAVSCEYSQPDQKLVTSPVMLEKSNPSTPTNAPSNKQRIRWTVELHDRFVEAVNKLDGLSESKKKYKH